MGKLDAKVAIVTGGGRGLGRAIAEAYGRKGACVAMTAARERAEINAVANSMGRDRSLALPCDVTDPRA